MGERHRDQKSHYLVFPYPTQQGHINPMLQFSKLLHHKGVKITLLLCPGDHFRWLRPRRHQRVESVEAYLESFKQVGLRTLAKLLEKLSSSGCPANCIVYDAFIPWPLDVAKKFGIVGVVFFTQSCAVDNIDYHAYKGLLKLPLTKYDQSKILLPGLPPVEPGDMPSRLYDFRSYPAIYDIVVGQFSNVDKAD
ncbi:hypothetical protein DVH24_014536 [Malus domestica]|uniref:Uncharacterized protein n=1 Tax=Malus domestica TaxID=3750 RepID=A0A498KI54_MALDO|nr:hypothetical protein DVH24_014536 [Malus domestica]